MLSLPIVAQSGGQLISLSVKILFAAQLSENHAPARMELPAQGFDSPEGNEGNTEQSNC